MHKIYITELFTILKTLDFSKEEAFNIAKKSLLKVCEEKKEEVYKCETYFEHTMKLLNEAIEEIYD